MSAATNLNELEEAIEQLYATAQRKINQLEWQLGAQRRYIEALEQQLESSVVEEIREELSEQEREKEEKN